MKNRESGFSLIEVLIVAVALGFILLGVTGLGGKIRSGIAAYGQLSDRHEREEIFTNALKRDFENVGLNLFEPPPAAASGQVDALFFPNSDFSVSNQNSSVNIARTAPGSNNPLISEWALRKGSGAMSFNPAAKNSYFTFYKPNGSSYSFYLGGAQEEGAWAIFANGSQTAASGNADTVLAGDRVTLALDNDNNGSCSMSYYRTRVDDRRLLARQTISCSNYPVQFALALEGGSGVNNFTLRGTFFGRVGGGSQPRPVKLPLLDGVQRSVPVWIDSSRESFTLLASDPDVDTSALIYPVNFRSSYNPQTLEISKPLRGSVRAGDYYLLIEEDNQHSIIGQVYPFPASALSSASVSFRPGNPGQPAWEMFCSAPSDFTGHQFSTRARLVKLLAPVTYQVVTDESDRSGSQGNRVIVRREGTAPWEKVAFGVTDFQISDQTVDNLHLYSLSFSTVPEDSDSVEPHRVSLSFSPAALNQ